MDWPLTIFLLVLCNVLWVVLDGLIPRPPFWWPVGLCVASATAVAVGWLFGLALG